MSDISEKEEWSEINGNELTCARRQMDQQESRAYIPNYGPR